MKALAIDVGTARIGVAFNQGSLVLALDTINRSDSSAREIVEIAGAKSVDVIFVGLPVSLGGGQTRSTSNAILFARELAEIGNTPVRLVDERLSTVSAASRLRAAGKNSKESRGIVDAEAARVILETALSGVRTVPLEEFDAG